MVSPLPNNIFFYWSKLKELADDKINVTEKLKFVLGRAENIVRKGENAGFQHFVLFPQCFQKASFTGSLKVGIVCQRVMLWHRFTFFFATDINQTTSINNPEHQDFDTYKRKEQDISDKLSFLHGKMLKELSRQITNKSSYTFSPFPEIFLKVFFHRCFLKSWIVCWKG